MRYRRGEMQINAIWCKLRCDANAMQGDAMRCEVLQMGILTWSLGDGPLFGVEHRHVDRLFRRPDQLHKTHSHTLHESMHKRRTKSHQRHKNKSLPIWSTTRSGRCGDNLFQRAKEIKSILIGWFDPFNGELQQECIDWFGPVCCVYTYINMKSRAHQ